MKLISGLALAALLAGTAAGAQPIDVTRLDMRPLLQLHAEGADFVGSPFQGDVFIYQGGYTLLAYSGGVGNASRIARGVATREQVAALNQALASSRIGQQRGGCGSPAPDYVAKYGLTWYGPVRVKTIGVGGNFSTCPTETVRILNATCEFIWSVLGPSPEVCVTPNP